MAGFPQPRIAKLKLTIDIGHGSVSLSFDSQKANVSDDDRDFVLGLFEIIRAYAVLSEKADE